MIYYAIVPRNVSTCIAADARPKAEGRVASALETGVGFGVGQKHVCVYMYMYMYTCVYIYIYVMYALPR